MQNYAIHNHLTPFISMQNHYNAIYREEEREMNPTLKVCYSASFRSIIKVTLSQLFGVGSIPWSALARGVLTRPWKMDSARSSNDPATVRIYSKDAAQEEIVKRYTLT